MDKKIILWISIIVLFIILLISGIWLINNQEDSEKDDPKVEITKPADKIIDMIVNQNSSVQADNLEVQKKKEDGKYKVIDKKQSTETNTIYYIVDPNNNEVKRFSVFKVTVGQGNQ